MVSSGDGGGGTCHNDKPGQSKDKVLKMESRRVEVREELEGGSGGTCHNDFFLLYAAWVRSLAERPSVSYTKVVMEVARTGHNLHLQKRINQQNCGSNKFLHRGGREDETDARAEHQTHWRGASNEWMKESGFRCSAGHQTHWQDASKGGVQKRACVDLRGRLGARK